MADEVVVRLRVKDSRAFLASMKGAAESVEDVGDKADKSKRKLKQMGDTVGKGVTSGFGLINKAASVGALAIAGAGAASLKFGMDFEQTMANVKAVSGATGSEFTMLKELALEQGAATKYSASEAASAMYELSSAGISVRDMSKTLKGTLSLAAASGIELADAAEIQAAALNGFRLPASKATHVADVLAQTTADSAVGMSDLQYSLKYIGPVAASTGQSFETMAAALAIMGNAGIKGEQAGTTLRGGLVRLVKPTKEVMAGLDEMGIKTKQLYGPKGLKPLPAIIDLMRKKTAGMSVAQKNNALASTFGTEALSGMLTLVNASPGEFDKLISRYNKADGNAKKMADTMNDTVKGALDQVTGSAETVGIRLFELASPAIKSGLGTVTDLINDAGKQLSHMPGMIQGVQAAFGKGLASPGNKDQSLGFEIGSKLKGVGNVAKEEFGKFVAAIEPIKPLWDNVLWPLIKGIGVGVIGSIVGAWKVFLVVLKVLATILGWVGQKAAPLKGFFFAIGVVIGWVFSGPILKAVGLLAKLGGLFGLVGRAAQLVAIPIRLVGLVFGFAFRMLFKFYAFLAVKLFGAFTRLPGIMGSAANAFKKFADDAWFYIRYGFLKVLDFVKGLGGKFLSAGKGLVSKLVQGIKGIGRAVVDAFGSGLGFAGDIGRALGNWLNDNTPLGDHVNLPTPLPDFDIPALASGGLIKTSGATLVGERGPELWSMPAGSRVDPLPKSRVPTAAGARSGYDDDNDGLDGGLTQSFDFYLDSKPIAVAVRKRAGDDAAKKGGRNR